MGKQTDLKVKNTEISVAKTPYLPQVTAKPTNSGLVKINGKVQPKKGAP
jgi:hypothetical protein